jgi:hypothetical protein
MSNAVAMDCWAPEVNLYPWNHQDAFDALYCESKGEEGAWTHGPYKGLMQSDHGTGDATHDLNEAFYEKYRGQGPSAWSETWGRDC